MSAVRDALGGRGLAFEVIPHERTYTTIEEARALGISADEVLKTVVLDTERGHALAVIPGSRKLDMRLVREAVGDRHVRLASEEEIERDFPGYALGAIPPMGSLLGVPMYVDPEVLEHGTVIFAAGSQTESVRIRTQDLLAGEPHEVAPLTRHPEEDV